MGFKIQGMSIKNDWSPFLAGKKHQLASKSSSNKNLSTHPWQLVTFGLMFWSDSSQSSFQELKDFPISFWLTIFVEGTRMTPDKLLAAQEFAISKGFPVPRNVLIPRSHQGKYCKRKIHYPLIIYMVSISVRHLTRKTSSCYSCPSKNYCGADRSSFYLTRIQVHVTNSSHVLHFIWSRHQKTLLVICDSPFPALRALSRLYNTCARLFQQFMMSLLLCQKVIQFLLWRDSSGSNPLL